MFVLVSFGKPAVSVCQGVTASNLVCEPVSLIDNLCLLCRCLLYVCLDPFLPPVVELEKFYLFIF